MLAAWWLDGHRAGHPSFGDRWRKAGQADRGHSRQGARACAPAPAPGLARQVSSPRAPVGWQLSPANERSPSPPLPKKKKIVYRNDSQIKQFDNARDRIMIWIYEKEARERGCMHKQNRATLTAPTARRREKVANRGSAITLWPAPPTSRRLREGWELGTSGSVPTLRY